MRVLLDSNAFYWALMRPDQFRKSTYDALNDPDTDVFFSAVNLWELAIKRAKGHFDFEDKAMLDGVARQGFDELPITTRHGLEAGSLPAHHRDPFDRMLIAQARLEGLTLVTSDRVFWRYRVVLLEA